MTIENQENTIDKTTNQENSEVQNQINLPTPETDPQEKKLESSEDPNWRAFREARKRDRQEKEAALRRAAEKEAEAAALKAAMEAAFAKEHSQVSQRKSNYYEESQGDDETEDQRIEKKIQAALALREEQYRREQQQKEQQMYPQRLSQTYPDFNSTVTEENLDYLEYHYPEVARPLKRHADSFEKWSDIYLAVKKFVPNPTGHKREAVKAEINQLKPKSISSTGLTQHTEVRNYLTDAQKAANWERMQRTLKSAS